MPPEEALRQPWLWNAIASCMFRDRLCHSTGRKCAFESEKVTWHMAKYSDPCSEFVFYNLPIQSAHTQQWTHTHLRRPGRGWGFCASLKGTSVMVSRVERALFIHSPHLQSLPARDSNPQTFNYESDSYESDVSMLAERDHFQRLKPNVFLQSRS